jgi:tetratricopeptide (TPR) repeat protein
VAFVNEHTILPANPNRTSCWCEYAEDLIYIANVLIDEYRTESASFWQNEVALFSVAKPKILSLIASQIEMLQRILRKIEKLLEMGISQEAEGDVKGAVKSYREAFDLSPTCAPAAELLIRCLLKTGQNLEALGLLPGILERHAYDSCVVRVVFDVLSSCGAYEQARGVCDEYLMFNPHDDEVRSIRNSLEHG